MNFINQTVEPQRPLCSHSWCNNLQMPQIYRYTSMSYCMRHYRVARGHDTWKYSDLQAMLELQKAGNRSYDHDIMEAKFDHSQETGHTCTNVRYKGYGIEKVCGYDILKLPDGTLMCHQCKATYTYKKPAPQIPLFKCKFCNSGLLILGGGKRTCVNCRSEFNLIHENTDKIETFVLVTVRRNY